LGDEELAVRLADTVNGMSIACGLDTFLALVILVIYLSENIDQLGISGQTASPTFE
jgi:hypothetical protein